MFKKVYNQVTKQMFSRDRLDSMFNIIAYNEEMELFWIHDENEDKHYLSVSYMCSALPAAGHETSSLLKSMLSADFPSGSFITLNMVSSTFVEPMINRFAHARSQAASDKNHKERSKLIKAFVDGRIQLYKKGMQTPLDNDTRVLLKDVYTVATMKIPIGGKPNVDDFTKSRTFAVSFKSALTGMNLFPMTLKAKDMVFVMRSMLYPGRKPDDHYNPNKPIKNQIVDSETYLKIKANHAILGDKYVQSLSVLRYPHEMILPVMSELLGDSSGSANQISCPFILTTHVHFPDSHAVRQKITNSARAIRTQAQGPFGRMVPSLRAKDENFTLLESSMDNGNRVLKVWTNLLLFSNTEEKLIEQSTSVKGFWEYLGFMLAEDNYTQGPCFQQQFPGNISPNSLKNTFRYSTVTTEHACELLPVVTDWRGNGTGANNIFYSHRGQLVLFDIFDSDSNFNTVIVGVSGSGKSFFCNDLVMGLYTRGGIVRVIDSGGSYEKLAETLGDEADYIDFTPERNIIINPFTDVKNIEDDLPTLKVVIEQMAAPKKGLTDYQLSQLEKYTLQAFKEYGNDMDMTLLSEMIIKNSVDSSGRQDREVMQLGEMLFPWTRHGVFSRYTTGRANLSFGSKPFSVLELDGLASTPELRVIVLLLMIRKLSQEFIEMGDKSVRKIFLIDEYWKFALTSEGTDDAGIKRVQSFLEESMRVFRKFNASCTIATQSIYDLGERSPLLENSANKVILKQQGSTVDLMKKNQSLSVSDYTYDRIKKLRRSGSSYSDMFITTADRGAGFCRFVLDEFSSLLYSTNAQEVSDINRYRDQGHDVATAIQFVLRDRAEAKEQQNNNL